MTTWEHKVVRSAWGWKGFDWEDLEAQLTELGALGWEVVGTLAPSVGAGQSVEVAVVLKRPAP